MSEALLNARTYFGVQLQPSEAAPAVVKLVLETAAGLGVEIKRLEAMGTLDVGARVFVRFRTELENALPVLERLLTGGRAVIRMNGTQFTLHLPGGRSAAVPQVRMLAVALPDSHQVYAGTVIEHWRDQFESA